MKHASILFLAIISLGSCSKPKQEPLVTSTISKTSDATNDIITVTLHYSPNIDISARDIATIGMTFQGVPQLSSQSVDAAPGLTKEFTEVCTKGTHFHFDLQRNNSVLVSYDVN